MGIMEDCLLFLGIFLFRAMRIVLNNPYWMCDTSLTQPWRKITYKYLNIKILQQICLIAEGKDIIFFVSFDRDLEEMSLIVILTHIEVMGTLGKVLEGELPLRIGLYRFLLTYQLHSSPRERRSA
ncbi:hypothetical protein HMPREF1551_00867 [Capnocytophaga sp. oral taxon 863 str. F0517]|nr:hypothetical protein HMPREF1551_00867 [Capnocytophaga sp. oral taxon 863 str. F0517]